jgi:hypothetical protein
MKRIGEVIEFGFVNSVVTGDVVSLRYFEQLAEL